MTARAHNDPAVLPRSPSSSHAVSVSAGLWTIHVGGQTADEGDLATQTLAAVRNVEIVLNDTAAQLDHVVSWTVQVVGDQDLEPVHTALQTAWAGRGAPPALTLARVAGLPHPASLVQISAIAVI